MCEIFVSNLYFEGLTGRCILDIIANLTAGPSPDTGGAGRADDMESDTRAINAIHLDFQNKTPCAGWDVNHLTTKPTY